MENRVKVRACFTGCNIKGKTVMRFELDPEHKAALPQLAMMTQTFVTLEITSDQMVIPVDMNSGEVLDGRGGGRGRRRLPAAPRCNRV